jgi:hypothetical protein
MGSAILIVLAVLILYIAFRFLKVTTGNSAYKTDDTAFLPDSAGDEENSAGGGPDGSDSSETGEDDDGNDP